MSEAGDTQGRTRDEGATSSQRSRTGGDGGTAEVQSEVVRLRAQLAAAQASQQTRRRTRTTITGLLTVLMSLSVVASTAAVWLHETLLDTETFIGTISPVFSDPAVTDPIGAYLTEQTFVALQVDERVDATLSSADAYIEEQVLGLIDIDPRIENRLAGLDRPRFTDLTSPLVSAAEGAVRDAVQGYLASEEFQDTFTMLATRGHQASVALLRGDYEEVPNVVIDSTSVRLDLTPAVAGTVQSLVARGVGIVGFNPPAGFTVPVDTPETARAWLSETFRSDLAPDFAQVTIMSTDRLEELQGTLRAFDRLVWLLVILVVALVVATVWVAPRKSRAIVQLAIGVVLSVALGRLVVGRLELVVIDAFGDPAGREVARIFIGRTLTSLRFLGLIVAVAAGVVGMVSFTVGRGWHRRMATAMSGWSSSGPENSEMGRFVAAHGDGLRVLGIGVAVMGLSLAGISFGSVVSLGLLLAIYLWALSALGRRSAPSAAGDEPAQDEEPALAGGPSRSLTIDAAEDEGGPATAPL